MFSITIFLFSSLTTKGSMSQHQSPSRKTLGVTIFLLFPGLGLWVVFFVRGASRMSNGVVVKSGGLGGEVPHQHLYVLNGSSALEEVGRKGLAQGFGSGPFPQSSLGCILSHLFAKPLS